MLIIWMGRLCFWAIWYGPFLHLGRFRIGRFCMWAVLGWAVFVWDDLVSGPTSPESNFTLPGLPDSQ